MPYTFERIGGGGDQKCAALPRLRLSPCKVSAKSLRESSELEFGADAAWLLIREGDSAAVTLRCVKSRHGRMEDVQLLFDGSRQQFEDDPAEFSWQPE